ncbi:MAG: acyl-[ACP]--phospholipid O-acyltransferase [Rhodospirillales bacterium]|nr:acyl-[ACP]--phospholipid O-acyltransferase [Rhodospirillales bacterium]
MQKSLFALLAVRRFLPLFATQFLGAFNDNFVKSALVILATYRVATDATLGGPYVTVLAGGLFILPFFLFSATAGNFADRFDKSRLIVAIKAFELGFMALAAIGFLQGNVPLLLLVLFLMGVHSTFFGPLKYGILPDHLRHDELLAGNALIDAGTFLAILIGTIAGGGVILLDRGAGIASAVAVGAAALGLAASLFVPRAPAAAPDLRLGLNFVRETRDMLRYAGERRDLYLCILGISWFWLIGATFLSQFPTYVSRELMADQHVVTLFLAVFSVGVGGGSILSSKLLKGEISARHVPFACLGISLFAIDLYFASRQHAAPTGALIGVAEYLAQAASWRVLVDLLGTALCGGLFIVPLYTMLQERSEPSHRARVIAANNTVNALFMVIAAVATAALLAVGFSVTDMFLIVGVLNLAVVVYIAGLLPAEIVKTLLATVLRWFYRVEIKGLENYKAVEGPAVIVVNHVSFLDGMLLAAFLPGRPMFAIDTFVAQHWWVKPLLKLVDALPLDPTNPLAMRTIVRAVQGGARCVIFPEGRITVTGALMKIYEGPGLIADRAQAKVIPIRIDGAQYTIFSRLKGKVPLRWFPRIEMTVLPARDLEVPSAIKGRARRGAVGRKLQDEMTRLVFETADRDRTLFESLLETRQIHGARKLALDDIQRKPITIGRLVTGSFVLGAKITAGTIRGERVGLMLPNTKAAAVAFFGLQAYGRVPALLNYTTGARAMAAACTAAEIGLIVTSRKFMEMARLQEIVAELATRARILYLEDLKVGLFAKLASALRSKFAASQHRKLSGAKAGDPAVVLFTSGSEGTPKGVVLSHANILANRYQLAAVIDFNPSDIVFNALPIFHSFGLTGGFLLPILSGIKTFLYPSPLHYRIVPEMVYETNATIIFGTNTFLSGYARTAHAYDFYSVRYVFAGAEKVKDETRRVWMEKFGLRILEGYGATETAPALAINTAMLYRAGTVGRLLPGIEHRLEPVPGVDRGGRLFVHGPNVMLGYLRAEKPGVIEPPDGGWYDTGDIVDIDEFGFVTILGRAKRFAKVAGEMVPLGAVEDFVARLWPGKGHAVVTVPDARKGEALVLVTEQEGAARSDMIAAAQKEGLPELFVPRIILPVKKLPLLGSGKTDYPAAKALAEEHSGTATTA